MMRRVLVAVVCLLGVALAPAAGAYRSVFDTGLVGTTSPNIFSVVRGGMTVFFPGFAGIFTLERVEGNADQRGDGDRGPVPARRGRLRAGARGRVGGARAGMVRQHAAPAACPAPAPQRARAAISRTAAPRTRSFLRSSSASLACSSG